MPKYRPYTKQRTSAECSALGGFLRQVKRRMQLQGFNQKRLAAVAGLDNAGLSITLNGGHAPSIERMATIAEALGMELEIRLTPPREAERRLELRRELLLA